ncbi:hypothetical protein [Kitasatospora sp. NPDC006786]|uniref:hypothetical protein n=1 Tax=unclassified Kitasatospora TaxID=2633591 RepID=UPI0033DF79E4
MSEPVLTDGPEYTLTEQMDTFLRVGFEQLKAAAAAQLDVEHQLAQTVRTVAAMDPAPSGPGASRLLAAAS